MKSNTTRLSSSETSSSSSLGSLLLFIGHACYAFNTLWDIAPNGTSAISKALSALPSWKYLVAEIDDTETADSFCSAIQNLNDSQEWRGSALANFHQLFHAPEPLVPLWESLWLSKEKIFFTEETTNVRTWYRRFNFAITATGFEAEDHIGLEIAFCGWLYEAAVSNSRKVGLGEPDFTMLNEFLDQHLGKWGPECLQELARQTQSPFWLIFLQTSEKILSALCQETE